MRRGLAGVAQERYTPSTRRSMTLPQGLSSACSTTADCGLVGVAQERYPPQHEREPDTPSGVVEHLLDDG